MKIGILGAGNIGKTLLSMLESVDDIDILTLADKIVRPGVEYLDAGTTDVENFVKNHDAVISALPFRFNKSIAEWCSFHGKNYFDFTEDTETTNYIQQLSNFQEGVFIPQCGLAPGFINIVGAALIEEFDKIENLQLRVGALPYSTTNQMSYYTTWSSAGLINEYIQPCDVLHNGKHIKVMPMEGLERIIVDGVEYEAFNTSGGLATMHDTYLGEIQNLSYKTMRYPGHCQNMKFILKDLNLEKTPEILEQIFDKNVPNTDDDIVLIYVNVVGMKNDKLTVKSYFKKIYPMVVDSQRVTAIQASTAAGMAGIIEMWLAGKFEKGFVSQETIKFDDFLKTRWGRMVFS